jgi:transposase
MEAAKRRFVGIDLGKLSWTMAIITRTGKAVENEAGEAEAEERTVFFTGKTTVDGRLALYGRLKEGDKIALEAGNLAFIMAKEIEKAVAGCAIRVLSPSHLPVIYLSDKKTDKEDAQKLAHLVADRPDSRLPIVPVPSDEEMGRRKLVSSYRREQGSRNQAVNRLHALFVHVGITTVVKKDLATAERREEAVKALTGLEREEAGHLLVCLGEYERRIGELEARMKEKARGDKRIELLESVPGVGPKIAFAFAAYVGEERFANASQVGNYLGLTPRVSISGSIVSYGHITKRGNGYLRALLVQGAWVLTWSKDGGALRERYEYMTGVKGKGKKVAIVAIARRLAELMYTLLKKGEKYEARRFKPGGERRGEEALALKALGA